MNLLPPPPAHVQPYVEVMGIDTAIEFFLAFGGRHMSFGGAPTGTSMVARRFGLDVAEGLARAADNSRIGPSIPIPKKWIARVLYFRGMTQNEIASKLRTTAATVRGYVAPVRDHRQADLFD